MAGHGRYGGAVVGVVSLLLACSNGDGGAGSGGGVTTSNASPSTSAAAPLTSSTSASSSTAASTPATRGATAITRNNVTLRVPAGWVTEGSLNYYGVGPVPRPPGTALLALEILYGFTDSIESLKPQACQAQVGNDRPTPVSVTAAESGFRPVGDRTAEYRNWSVSCPNNTVEGHRAWVLPQSRIAFYERCRMDAVGDIVATAQVTDTAQATSSSVRPPRPESPFSCRA